jgi:arylsulfatase
VDKYKGKFAHGWDEQREITYAKQKELGVIGPDAELTPRHAEIPAWDAMDPKLKPVLEREMEVYAGFMEHTDYHVGRVIDALQDLCIYDDTLVYLIIGDNGASAEGTLQGAFNEMANLNGMGALETPEFMVSKLDKFGTPESYGHFAVGWAWAMDTPYQWTKQVASHWGGTRNGTIVRWPKRIQEKGGIRNQFCHLIDVARRCWKPRHSPSRRWSMACSRAPVRGDEHGHTFNDANAPERHDVQYFEMFGNRGIYYKGWSAVTKHRTPWVMVGQKMLAFDDDIWELYDGSKDWSQAHDLSKQMPDKLHELQRQFLIEATRYNVLPLDDRQVERALSE